MSNAMNSVPLSAYEETLGMIYFARMLDKIRLNAAGNLREDFRENLGTGLDGRCVGFLQIDYANLVERVLRGGSNQEILEWCFLNGRKLTENDTFIWNHYLKKVGWNDGVSEILVRRKKESGLEDRDEIQTMPEYFEYDEGRK